MRTTHHVRDSFAQNVDHLAHDTPLSAFFAEVVCTLGATPPRTSTSPPQTATSPPPNGGNCTIRGATRRRHAVVRLLMVQNPHRQRCDALRKGQRARAGPGAACFPMTPPPNGGNCSIRGATRRRHAEARLLVVQNPPPLPLVSCSLTDVMLPQWRMACCGDVAAGILRRPYPCEAAPHRQAWATSASLRHIGRPARQRRAGARPGLEGWPRPGRDDRWIVGRTSAARQALGGPPPCRQ